MAVTRVLLKATQYRLIYSVTHDGGGGDTLQITSAQMLADAAAAPLMQELLNTEVANATAAATLMLGTPGRTFITPTNNGLAPQVWSASWAEVANRSECIVRGATGVASDAILEIQLTHTLNR